MTDGKLGGWHAAPYTRDRRAVRCSSAGIRRRVRGRRHVGGSAEVRKDIRRLERRVRKRGG